MTKSFFDLPVKEKKRIVYKAAVASNKAQREIMKEDCTHWRVKVRKHRENHCPCLHCLFCDATWSDPMRALSMLKTAKSIHLVFKHDI